MNERTPPKPTRENDLYGWAKGQAAVLREGRMSELQAGALAEEIEKCGSSQYDKLEPWPPSQPPCPMVGLR